jgi:ribose 5-phosphate isomerase B
MKKIIIGSDHAAFEAKEILKKSLEGQGFELDDVGTHSLDSCHYPDYAIALAKKLKQNPTARGILLCGSGIGVSIVANRFSFIRAALCRTAIDAKLSRQHNDANVLCLGARINSETEIMKITLAWLETKFEGSRHQDRLNLFSTLGEK